MKNYIVLMKLRVVELLLVTTVPALFLATNGVPDLAVTVWSLFGGTLAAGGANAFNMVIEADTDRLMKRTSNRPISNGQISKQNALIFSFLVSIISLAIFYIFTTPLATLLTALAIVFYVLGYTILLKRNTSQNIVWGGIAGCMPVLIGQAAVSNSLTLTSWLFFLVVFFWTPPHFWALAVRYKSDYQAAGIPMLPVVAPIKTVIRQMWFHSISMMVVSLLVIQTAKLGNWIFVLTLLLLIFWKLQLINLTRVPSEANAG
ncbi:MAG: protoheme IX farnesyltransferase, partial [Actinobacteria bacterium]|nr:protoheme IX farnesyltransferase [Actinomycetota bacterium]